MGWPVTFRDLEHVDDQVYRNLTELLNIDDVKELYLEFVVTEDKLGGYYDDVSDDIDDDVSDDVGDDNDDDDDDDDDDNDDGSRLYDDDGEYVMIMIWASFELIIIVTEYPYFYYLSINLSGVTETVDLIPGGSEIPVDNSNLPEYLGTIVDYWWWWW